MGAQELFGSSSRSRHTAQSDPEHALRGVDTMALAVYYKLWAMTANWTQRKNYGWYQLWTRMMPWCFTTVPLVGWFSFGWWSDDFKKILTLGIYEPPLIHWDTNMTPYRSDFV